MSQGEKPAYQDRSRAAREKIVNALDAALREKPFDQVSVSEIAERAGVAVGTVYRRFENKDALIPVIMEIYQARLESWQAGEGAVDVNPEEGLRKALRAIMATVWSGIAREAHLLRAVHLYTRLKPEICDGPEWKKYEKAAASTVAQVLEFFSAEVKRKNIKRANATAAYMLNAIFVEKALYPEEQPATLFPYSGKTLADEFADMLYAYLQLPEE
ncbi:MAG: hypothetical protein DHS20C05_13850 [Hyphococcus sp.]|nr:MAG: hypothetical protein DHS20C05_13850 [Marinicaulis sp.]